ncbi:hypothetical protein ASPZODRAFT_103197 [Penicilliopsis zonata CBS 506.65]|uniref:cystathionine gamma-synthase n=1 Tax=Penicilliopsis zonata CBS 506.65 TaxID=1073090 RepID=A0A1L9S861_9EURO|nr:hypothetical protein ASPZODRAFT_103197 [Penicilliopsis zonata CBS 506.65]OJJ43342.1 hypothetical protein ASPZODRAFT_103197 [Penicilliopsis zonata CBS 506.65]
MLQAVGGPIPPNTDHAVSMSLPTWQATVGYEEGEDWVISKIQCGYPRFFIHPTIQRLVQEITSRYGDPKTESATLFPSHRAALICQAFFGTRVPPEALAKVRIVNLVPSATTSANSPAVTSNLSCVIYPKEYAAIAKQVWQHSGNGISSRRAEFCLDALTDGFLVEEKSAGTSDMATQRFNKGPRRYRGKGSFNGLTKGEMTRVESSSSDPIHNGLQDGKEYGQFIEERFGRNLSTSLAEKAKTAVRRRIAGFLTADVELSEALEKTSSEGRVVGLTEEDVFLFPSGMSSIFNAHRILMASREPLKSICFGFPYIDSLKILQKWGPGCLFYDHGSSEDLDDLEDRLSQGERFLALFTEVPGNPLLKSPDLKRIRHLADKYDFAVVVDETVGNFLNINVLPYADIVVSSLTKIFSGDSNVMGGSGVLNPLSPCYVRLKDAFAREYEDILWAEDAIFLERNSRDFVSRSEKVNSTTEAVTELLQNSKLVKEVHYPKFSPTRPFYDSFRNPNGGYGGLFSVTFHSKAAAMAFFDYLEVFKGPSLGTNFTLSCPYAILAHYTELDWALSCGIDPNLVRISVGLEDVSDLSATFQKALDAVAKIDSST